MGLDNIFGGEKKQKKESSDNAPENPSRRQFLRTGASAVAAGAIGSQVQAFESLSELAEEATDRKPERQGGISHMFEGMEAIDDIFDKIKMDLGIKNGNFKFRLAYNADSYEFIQIDEYTEKEGPDTFEFFDPAFGYVQLDKPGLSKYINEVEDVETLYVPLNESAVYSLEL